MKPIHHNKMSEKNQDTPSKEVIERITNHLSPLVKTSLSVLDSLGSLKENIHQPKPTTPNNKNTDG